MYFDVMTSDGVSGCLLKMEAMQGLDRFEEAVSECELHISHLKGKGNNPDTVIHHTYTYMYADTHKRISSPYGPSSSSSSALCLLTVAFSLAALISLFHDLNRQHRLSFLCRRFLSLSTFQMRVLIISIP